MPYQLSVLAELVIFFFHRSTPKNIISPLFLLNCPYSVTIKKYLLRDEGKQDHSRIKSTKGWSQSDLAAKNSISRMMSGKYEREEAVPSIEVAKKIAQTSKVLLDYLAGICRRAMRKHLNLLQVSIFRTAKNFLSSLN